MSYLIEVPVESGARLLVQASDDDLPGDLELAALRPGEIVTRASKSLEQALEQIRPAVNAFLTWMKTMSPDEVGVEFGIVLGGEAGVIIAKGTGEVHFTVTLAWKGADKVSTNNAVDHPDAAGSKANPAAISGTGTDA
jgi:hypothetical protein